MPREMEPIRDEISHAAVLDGIFKGRYVQLASVSSSIEGFAELYEFSRAGGDEYVVLVQFRGGREEPQLFLGGRVETRRTWRKLSARISMNVV